ncbi:MAG: capsular biosynthesis protein [Clostridium sp.]|jgi:tetratricopeptide (TPR) repeat protein|uniref:tetratricopeptide repeat protein n=1 Tax=Clostridium sp. TaxID=1506 RepID=UPI0025BD7490|nr:capsular biosynthesis protein [Clostridium sp.]MCH3962849.1 capsular biosynthesis protein [Clostridium sp.]MCI1715736.1 capsular biosynthesis protein [Clostridium sp.]MCI1800059.1 capsular biosynthesis protein [Clostridium sp.]MCI1813973.1 capsular biosynthesis protein [Clostridium sp.]MCI1870871.1 capsular biosynthesis protein [Clostridium sp.]
MNIKARLKDKLSNILFLEIDETMLEKIFKVEFEEQIYLPVKADNIIESVKSKNDMEKIPAGFFIEGMFYVMGTDGNFKFNHYYIDILKKAPDSVKFIKGKIARGIKNGKYEDAYILFKGLLNIDNSTEIYDKLIITVDYLRREDSAYKEEELEILENAESIENYALPYFYHAVIEKENDDYEKALFYINSYISKGGEETIDITDFKESVKSIVDFDRAREILNENPEEALKILLPLIDVLGDHPSIYYYVAVGYRMLQNYEKAVYYLNEALSINSSMVEIINEMGINYASMGDYKTAVSYLRKAFEATKSVEICTNLIMCYLNLGDLDNAAIHLDIAKKLDPKDEIVIQLEDIIKKNRF